MFHRKYIYSIIEINGNYLTFVKNQNQLGKKFVKNITYQLKIIPEG